MKRLGMYTGTIYEDGAFPEECCLQITDEQANDKEYLRIKQTVNGINCRKCLACHEAMKEN